MISSGRELEQDQWDRVAQRGFRLRVGSSADLGKDWGTAELAAALYTVSTDMTRIKPLLPELSPADRQACLASASLSRTVPVS